MTREEERSRLAELLARCAADDTAAQREFANRSYLNTVYQAVVRTVEARGGDLDPRLLGDLATACVFKVYESGESLVSRRRDFRQAVAELAIAFTSEYLRRTSVRRRPCG